VISGEVLLRVCPQLVVVCALDDLAADAVDALASGRPLHRRIVGAAHPAGANVSRMERAEVTTLPEWPTRTVAVLSSVDPAPHAIPISAPVRVDDRRVLFSLHRERDSLARLRERPEVALTVLAEDNVAFTARGRARVVQEPMAAAPDYAAVELEVEHVDDHRQPAFEVDAGVGRRWVDESEQRALGERVQALRAIASDSAS
jgi:hypothetical protein